MISHSIQSQRVRKLKIHSLNRNYAPNLYNLRFLIAVHTRYVCWEIANYLFHPKMSTISKGETLSLIPCTFCQAQIRLFSRSSWPEEEVLSLFPSSEQSLAEPTRPDLEKYQELVWVGLVTVCQTISWPSQLS